MSTRRWFLPILAGSFLALGLLACNLPTAPEPPSSESPSPTDTVAPEPPPSDSPSPTDTIAPEPPPSDSPSPTDTIAPTAPTPTATVDPSWLPLGTDALYVMGPWQDLWLYALSADGSSTELNEHIRLPTEVSRTGRWIAFPSGSGVPDSMAIHNLDNGTSHIIQVTGDFDVYGAAFGLAETRLAFLEAGMPLGAGQGTPWAIVVVSLEDGSITRFDVAGTAEPFLLPRHPISWSDSGEEVVLNAFLPFTEEGAAGLSVATLPPGTSSAQFDTLGHRELLAGGTYDFEPSPSPDGTSLLFLARDFEYIPDGYEPEGYDLAVNQLWTLNLESGNPTLLLDVTDGGALGSDAAWSPDGTEILFAEGDYDGAELVSLMLRTGDQTGAMRDIGPLQMPSQGWLSGVDWCSPGAGLLTIMSSDGTSQLHAVDLGDATMTLLTSAPQVAVVGCVR